MSDCQDMTTALARELTQGIEGEVEDLGAVFKRMALLKPEVDVILDEGSTEAVVADVVADYAITDNVVSDGAVADNDIVNDTIVVDEIIDDVVTEVATPIASTPAKPAPNKGTTAQSTKERAKPKPPTQSSGLLSMLNAPKPKRTQKKKSSTMLENQMSLFDMMESTA